MNAPKLNPQEEEWEDPYPKKKSRNWPAAIFLSIGLYVLSIGPAKLMEAKGIISQDTMDSIYAPLIALAERFPFFDSALEWYLGMWGK